MKIVMSYISVKILIFAIENENFNFKRFNIKMTLFYLTSLIRDVLSSTVKTKNDDNIKIITFFNEC